MYWEYILVNDRGQFQYGEAGTATERWNPQSGGATRYARKKDAIDAIRRCINPCGLSVRRIRKSKGE